MRHLSVLAATTIAFGWACADTRGQDAPPAPKVELVGLEAFAQAHPKLVPARFTKGFANKMAEAEHPFPSAVLGLTLLHGNRAQGLGVKKGQMKPAQWRAFEAEVRAETMVRFAQGLAVPMVTARSLELEKQFDVSPASIEARWQAAAEALPRARAKVDRAEHLRFFEAWARFLVRTEHEGCEYFDDAVAHIEDRLEELDVRIKVPRKLGRELEELRAARAEARTALGEPPQVDAEGTVDGLRSRAWLGDGDKLERLRRTRPVWEGVLTVEGGANTLEIQWPWRERPEPLVAKRCVVESTGWMRVPSPGLYRLVVAFDDFARLELGGEVAIDAWTQERGGPIVGTFYTVTAWLEEDTPLTLTIADVGSKLAISMGLNRLESGSWTDIPLELCHRADERRR